MILQRKIVFTGGGSAGHVIPNVAVIEKCLANNWQIFYIGTNQGIEKNIIENFNVTHNTKISYFGIATGKLCRYFSWQNFIAPFKIIIGIIQAFLHCRKLKPQVIFAKGGFVAFPVVVAGFLHRIPVIVHESDVTLGLANKLSIPFASKICVSFPETSKYFANNNKVIVTGNPVREKLLAGNAKQGRSLCGFNDSKKIILVMGGGGGSAIINQVLRDALPKLIPQYQVVHICGKGKMQHNLTINGYKQFEFLNEDFADVLACADLVIARSGSNTVWELITLNKPHILIPLSTKFSRGDQLANAQYFAALNLSQVIFEQELTPVLLLNKIAWLMTHEEELREKLQAYKKTSGIKIIYAIINEACLTGRSKDAI